MNAVATGELLTNKDLIEPELWRRLVARIMVETGHDVATAEAIMDQSLGFLRLCAEDPNNTYSPSPIVDIGWHTFLLYTREYSSFCKRLAGRFIHHAPSDEEGVDYGAGEISDTVAAMRELDISVIETMWAISGGCDNGVSCANNCRGHRED